MIDSNIDYSVIGLQMLISVEGISSKSDDIKYLRDFKVRWLLKGF